jgi:NDP-sugar pyrophosphorylase family protein
VNAGIYVVEREVMARLPAGAELDIGLDVLPGVARDGRLAAFALARPVIDMGTPENLRRARGA